MRGLRLLVLAPFLGPSLMAQSWDGFISDSQCGYKHSLKSPNQACIVACIKGGAAAVFVVDDKVYRIENPDALKNYIGHRVTITGTLDGQTIHVDDVKMGKL
jgi:hypothetical protein